MAISFTVKPPHLKPDDSYASGQLNIHISSDKVDITIEHYHSETYDPKGRNRKVNLSVSQVGDQFLISGLNTRFMLSNKEYFKFVGAMNSMDNYFELWHRARTAHLENLKSDPELANV